MVHEGLPKCPRRGSAPRAHLTSLRPRRRAVRGDARVARMFTTAAHRLLLTRALSLWAVPEVDCGNFSTGRSTEWSSRPPIVTVSPVIRLRILRVLITCRSRRSRRPDDGQDRD